jgi:hypothetical protein
MTPNQFRKIALSFPESVEGEHMEHPDFRVCGKIFATLLPDESWGMVKLTPDQQSEFVHDHPDMFAPFAGAWGKKGCIRVHLQKATSAALRPAMLSAWMNTAPKKLVEAFLSE